MEIDVEALKRDWTGFTFDTAEFEALAEDLVGFALACGETAKRYTDPSIPTSRRCRTTPRATSAGACCPTISRGSAAATASTPASA